MNTSDIAPTLRTLLSEIALGAPATGAFVLNSGDPGLLAALDRLSAAEASRSRDGGAAIAAHVAHVTYGVSLMNRWATGEEAFANADWAAAWRIADVDDERWTELRNELRDEVTRWVDSIGTPRDVDRTEIDGIVASVVHLAYHLGAIRQIVPALRGPKESATAAKT